MRRAGKWLVALGTIAIIAGAVLLPLGMFWCFDCSWEEPADRSEMRKGGAMTGSGAALLSLGHAAVIVGPALWGRGSARVDRARRIRLQSPPPMPDSVVPRGGPSQGCLSPLVRPRCHPGLVCAASGICVPATMPASQPASAPSR